MKNMRFFNSGSTSFVVIMEQVLDCWTKIHKNSLVSDGRCFLKDLLASETLCNKKKKRKKLHHYLQRPVAMKISMDKDS